MKFVDDHGNPIMWTVLFGENGTGKSTILQLIALLLSDKYAIMELTDSQPNRLLRYGCERGLAKAIVQLDKKSKKKKKRFEIGWHIFDAPRERSLMEIGMSDRASFENEMLFLCGYGETRTPSHGPFLGRYKDSSDERAIHLISLFKEGVPLRPIDGWLMKLDYQYMKRGKPKRSRFESAVNALVRILPGAPEFLRMTEEGEALFETSYGDIPLGQLSSGYRDVLCFLMDIASRLFDAYPSSKNPLKEKGIVIIDEIALHLHPRWQQVIVGRLRKRLPKIQFITSTHSPLVAQSLEENELVTLVQVKRSGKADTVEVTRHWGYSPKALSSDQLLTSPIFGLQSAKSLEIERKRTRLQTLRDKIAHGVATPKEEDEYQKIVDTLTQLGEAPGDTERERAFYAAVEAILSEMGQIELLERPSVKQLKKLSEESKK